MSEPGPTTSIRILDEEFWVRGASPERVEALAGLVDQRFRELTAARPLMDWKRLAVMVCMNLAEELNEERTRREQLIQKAWNGVHGSRVGLEIALDAGDRSTSTLREGEGLTRPGT